MRKLNVIQPAVETIHHHEPMKSNLLNEIAEETAVESKALDLLAMVAEGPTNERDKWILEGLALLKEAVETFDVRTILTVVIGLETEAVWVGGKNEYDGGKQHFKLSDGRIVTPRCACGKQKACMAFSGYTIDS